MEIKRDSNVLKVSYQRLETALSTGFIDRQPRETKSNNFIQRPLYVILARRNREVTETYLDAGIQVTTRT